MAKRISIQGTQLSHGGSVTSFSPNVKVNGKFVVRLGDRAQCSIHGSVTVSSASGFKSNGIKTALEGDTCSCGAVLVAPFSTTVTTS